MGKTSTRRGRRWIRRLGLLMLAVVAAYAGLRCIPPASFRATKTPREGRAMNSRVGIVYSKHYQINLGGAERLHSFDIHKCAKIYLELQTEGLIRPKDVFVPERVTDEQVLMVHTPGFLAGLSDAKTIARYLEVPIISKVPSRLVDAGVLEAFRWTTGGTILAGRLALKHGIAVNIGGGYHHAKPAAGEGFCIFADMAIAIRQLQRSGLIRSAAVIDLDVHQGNGTAVCFAGDDSVFTFSMHEGDIYPVPKETSDLDVELAAGTGDREFLRLLRRHLPAVLDRGPFDIVFLQAGCDTLAGDPLARLAMTHDGIVRRDAMVIDECVARGIPVVMTLGGGYSETAWQAQAASIRRTIESYGLPGGRRQYPPRKATGKEKLYIK